MASQKVTTVCARSHTSSILSHMQLLTKKGTSWIVEQPLRVQIVYTNHIVIVPCMKEKKGRKKKKTEIFTFNSLNCEKD